MPSSFCFEMKLHAERFGDGPPLVVLHGLLGSGDNWLGLTKIWAQQSTVLVPDLRNHGRSPHADETSIAAMAGDIAELLGDHACAPAVILGHSLGGKVAMRMALDSPQHVAGLIVVDIAPRAYPPAHESIFRAMLAIDLSQHATRTSVEQELAGSIPEPSVRQWLLKNLGRDAHGRFVWKPNLPALSRDLAELSAGFAAVSSYDGPALFIRGGRSCYLTEEDSKGILPWFPQAKVETLAEAGHWVHVDAPGRLSQLVQDFMASV